MSITLLKKAMDNLNVKGHAVRANVIRDYKEHRLTTIKEAEELVIFAMNLDALENSYLNGTIDQYAFDYLREIK